MSKKKLTKEEEKISQKAVLFIKHNKKLLITKFANPKIFTARKEPVTIFMAGAPGAGKTEISRAIIKKSETKPVRIDADDIRELFVDMGYNGKNSFIFQQACSHGVDKLFDYIQQKKLHAIIDGTFAHNRAIDNVRRALGRDRKVFIYFVCQDPKIAWKIARGREIKEGRNIPKQVFVDAYFNSISNVNKAKRIFKNKIGLNVIIKNVEYNQGEVFFDQDNLDQFIKARYTKSKLLDILSKI